MRNLEKNLISSGANIKQALEKLNDIPLTLTLFVHNNQKQILGTITDGDIRRGLLKGLSMDDLVDSVMNTNYKFISRNSLNTGEIKKMKDKGIAVLPVIDENKQLIKLLELRNKRTILPVDAVIMAGGKGERLHPLTKTVPKPLLPVDDKPILHHNIDRLSLYGIENYFISINYLGEKIIEYFRDENEMTINYVREGNPLGTIGAVSLINDFSNETVLVMNSDLLTNIDYEDFYNFFCKENADIAVASVPYKVQVPYAILDTKGSSIHSFEEKPVYTYYSNGGIYLIKRSLLNLIPVNQKYNATDLLDDLIKKGSKVVHYPIYGYWLDIGRHEDYKKAQEDIKYIKF